MNTAAAQALSPTRTATGLMPGTAIPPVEPTQMENEFRHLATTADDLSSLVDCIDARLVGVIRPLEPANCAVGASPEIALVPMAEALRRERRRVEQSITRLRSILGRLEV